MSKADESTTTVPTEDQVKSANEAEMAKWEGDYKEEDLVVPYKREEVEEAKDDRKVEKADEEAEDEPETVTYTAPVVQAVEDPGEYKPADYSFEVTNKDGKTVKITTPEQADAFGDDDDNFKTAKDLKDFIRKSQKMENSLEKDEADHKKKQEEFQAFKQSKEAKVQTMNTMASEFDYLVSKGSIPEVAKEYKDADWFDPEVKKQPGIKEYHQITDYMIKENAIRAKAGLSPITSVLEGYAGWKLESGKSSEEADQKAEGEARKRASARVAGVSATAQAPFVPKGIAVGNPNVFKRNEAQWD